MLALESGLRLGLRTTLFDSHRVATLSVGRLFCGIRKNTTATTTRMPNLPKFKPVELVPTTATSSPREDDDNGFKFRIVSYNILAQELDEYDNFYKEKLVSNGYSSIYIQRSGQKRDGCGIFYKNNSAELLLEERIEYNDLVPSVQGGESSCNENCDAQATENTDVTVEGAPPKKSTADRGDPNDPCVRLKRDCVGIMGAFELKDCSQHIVIVANTHIYWDPKWADVKLAQAKYLLLRLSKFKAIVSNKFGCRPSVIVCGDFNSTPGDKVYQYLVSGSSSAAPPPDDCDDLPIPLCSVYASTGGEPPFTNCTPTFTDTLDYIFFSPNEYLKPASLLELPGPESPDVAGGLPNFLHPSDHLPIGADFEVTIK